MFSAKPDVGERLTSFATVRSANAVEARVPAERQSFPVGLIAEEGVWPEPPVRSVQAVLVMVVSVPAPAVVVRFTTS